MLCDGSGKLPTTIKVFKLKVPTRGAAQRTSLLDINDEGPSLAVGLRIP